MVELLAQSGGRLQVSEPQYLVVAALEINALFGELATKPLATVDIDLDRVRCPGLHTHMHPAKLGIDQIPIQVQAFAVTPDNFEAMCLAVTDHCKRGAGLQHREDAHQTFCDLVTPCNLLRLRFLGLAAGMGVGGFEINVGPTGLLCNILGVIDDAGRFGFEKLARIFE